MPAPLLTAEAGPARLEVVVADITTLEVDAIVNAANARCSAAAASTARSTAPPDPSCWRNADTLGGCATGSAKITRGYRLPARHVIHAVGPVWNGGGRGEDDLLASCYRTALDARRASTGLQSIAFPAISTGVYRFPADRAARDRGRHGGVGDLRRPARHRARGVLLLRAGGGGASHGCVRGTGAGADALERCERCRTHTFGSTSSRTTSPAERRRCAGRIDLHHRRIVARHDVVARGREPLQRLVALQHLGRDCRWSGRCAPRRDADRDAPRRPPASP